jgi:hypothetical protein
MRGGASINCANCHGGGLAGMSLNMAGQGNAANDKLVCDQVLSKMSAPPNVANSLIVQKVTAANVGHSGGKVADTAAWQAAFVNNAADQTLVCNQVLSKMTAPPNLANSLIIQKVTNANVGHSGGKVADTAAWQATFVNNSAVFF